MDVHFNENGVRCFRFFLSFYDLEGKEKIEELWMSLPPPPILIMELKDKCVSKFKLLKVHANLQHFAYYAEYGEVFDGNITGKGLPEGFAEFHGDGE